MIKVLKTFFSVVKGFRRHLFFVALLGVATAGLEGFSAGLVAPLLQSIISGKPSAGNLFYRVNSWCLRGNASQSVMLIEICLFLFLGELLTYFRKVYEKYCEEQIKKSWRVKIYANYICYPYSFFVSKRHGELISNIISETERGISAMYTAMELISTTSMCICFTLVLFITSFNTAVCLMAVFMAFFYIVKKTMFGYSERVGRDRILLSQDINSHASETINGILQVKLFNLESDRVKKFKASNSSYASMMIKYFAYRLLPMSAIKIVLFAGGFFVVLSNVFFHFLDLKAALPLASTFFVVSIRLFDLVSALISNQMNFLNYYPSMNLLDVLLRRQSQELSGEEMASKKNKRRDIAFVRNIEFENVSFAYEKKLIFSNLNMTIPCKKKIGIAGLSGSGKTTLIYQMLGIYYPGEGDIKFDGVSIKDIDLSYLRSKIGVVSQDNFIFNGTIKENIAVGLESVDDLAIVDAAKKAHAHEFISVLKEGYDTFIGEKGLKLSGGQRQRLAIARAILRDPKIFIFDEATNSLDKESENLVIDAINILAKDKIVVLVSHDLTIVNTCDKIILLKGGAVVEEGTHKELMDRKQDYWQLYSNMAKRV